MVQGVSEPSPCTAMYGGCDIASVLKGRVANLYFISEGSQNPRGNLGSLTQTLTISKVRFFINS